MAIVLKLLAVFAVVALGWVAGRARWLGDGSDGDPARVLSAAAFQLFVPALLFRTTARLDLSRMPWSTTVAFFVPALGLLLVVYAVQRVRQAGGAGVGQASLPAAPGVRALTATFGNTVQLGIPMVAALFGEAALSVHLAIVSLHALTLLTTVTLLVELDCARAQAREAGARAPLGRTLLATVRATVIHPVVLPVLAGLAWNAAGLRLAPLVDETLLLLGQAVVPLCLVVIGVSLERHGLKGSLRGALWIGVVKLVVLPALVLVAGRWGAGLHGVPLATIVLCAALPAGSNPQLFAQRYRTLEAETGAAVVVSTLAFAVTAPLWLALAAAVG